MGALWTPRLVSEGLSHLTTLVQERKLRALLSALVKGQAHSTLLR